MRRGQVAVLSFRFGVPIWGMMCGGACLLDCHLGGCFRSGAAVRLGEDVQVLPVRVVTARVFCGAPIRRTGLVSRMGLMGAAALASCIAILVALLCGRGGSAWWASLAPFIANSLLAVVGAAAFIWRCLRLEALPSMAWEGRPRGVLRRHATGARRWSR